MGVSGSGKSTVMHTLERRLGWSTAEGDAFHPPANVAKMASGMPLSDEDRRPWLDAIAAWIGEQEAADRSSVVTCSALKRAYRDLLRRGHPSCWFVHLDPPAGAVARRLEVRAGHYMPASLLGSQYAALEPLQPGEPGISVTAVGPLETVVDEILARLPAVTA